MGRPSPNAGEADPLKYSLTTRFKDRHILKLLAPLSGKTILDVGCGIGYLSGLAAEQGATVFGMDPDLDCLRVYSDRACSLPLAGSAFYLPLQENVFDGVIMADVIEHLPFPEQALKEVHRVLKANGRLVVSTPHSKGWLAGTYLKERLIHGQHHGHQRHYMAGYDETALSRLYASCRIAPDATIVTNPLTSELFLGLVKLGYAVKKPTYTSQAQLTPVANSLMFRIYRRLLFPWMYAIGRLEERLLGDYIPGHCIVMRGIAVK